MKSNLQNRREFIFITTNRLKIFTALFLIFFAVSAEAAKVLTIVFDGTAYLVAASLYNRDKLPNLKQLGELGQITAILSCFNTGGSPSRKCNAGATRDQHAVMITGVSANTNRVWSNKDFRAVPDGMTIYEKLRNEVPGIKLAQIGKCHFFNKDTLLNAIPEMDIFEDCKPDGNGWGPGAATTRIKQLINQWTNEPNWFIFANFVNPDVAGHTYGIHSAQYRESIILNDQLLGNILAVTPRDAEIFIVGDHGFGTMNLQTGISDPKQHSGHTPSTIFVRRGVVSAERHYMDELFPMWLNIFGLTSAENLGNGAIAK